MRIEASFPAVVGDVSTAGPPGKYLSFHLSFCFAGFYLPSVLKGLQRFYGGEKNTRKMTYPDDTDGRTGRRGPFNVAFGSFSKIVDSGLYPVPFRVTVMVGRQLPQQRPGWGPLSTLFSALCLE